MSPPSRHEVVGHLHFDIETGAFSETLGKLADGRNKPEFVKKRE